MRIPQNVSSEVSCVEKFEEAKEFFNNGQYDKALDLLEQIKIELSSNEEITSWVLKHTLKEATS
jgi:predicted nucleotidyltransferase